MAELKEKARVRYHREGEVGGGPRRSKTKVQEAPVAADCPKPILEESGSEWASCSKAEQISRGGKWRRVLAV